MEFGLSRFLEMFEERFGRTVTTAILGIFGFAVTVYCLKVIVEGGISAYHLVQSANLIEALKQESAASHIIVFLIQIGITFVILAFIWRWFFSRERQKAEARLKETEAKMIDLETTVRNDVEKFKREVEALENREDRLTARMDELKAKQQVILEKFDKRELPKSTD